MISSKAYYISCYQLDYLILSNIIYDNNNKKVIIILHILLIHRVSMTNGY